MTPFCEQVLEQLGKGPLSPQLQAHVGSCPACARMVQAFEAMEEPARLESEPGAMDALRAEAVRELAAQPAVAAPWWREALAIVGLCLVVGVVGLLLLSRHGLVNNRANPLALAGMAALLVGVITWGAYAALAPGGRLLRRGLIAFALETAVLVGLTGSGLNVEAPFLKLGMACGLTELGLSVVPLGAALWLLARVAYQPERAFAAGLATGAVGMLVLHLHCACGTLSHLMLFHIAPWLLLAAGAVYLRSRLPSRTYAP